jgi:hypothetical protein
MATCRITGCRNPNATTEPSEAGRERPGDKPNPAGTKAPGKLATGPWAVSLQDLQYSCAPGRRVGVTLGAGTSGGRGEAGRAQPAHHCVVLVYLCMLHCFVCYAVLLYLQCSYIVMSIFDVSCLLHAYVIVLFLPGGLCDRHRVVTVTNIFIMYCLFHVTFMYAVHVHFRLLLSSSFTFYSLLPGRGG